MPGVDESSGGVSPTEFAASIRDDFRALVINLELQIGQVSDPASEAMETLRKARTAAKLGVELSDRLLKSIQDNAEMR